MGELATRRIMSEVDEQSPDSGVYASGEHASTAGSSNAQEPEGDSGGLSYKVYTLKELESRGISADLSVNSTRMSVVMMAPKHNPWADVARAALNVVRLAKTWVLAPAPRPPAKDVFRAPVVAITFELRQALKAVEWRKVGIYAGVSVGVFLFLLFAVVTAADLTDDLKPSRVTNTQSGDSYTNAIVAAQHPPPPVAAAPATTGDGLEVTPEATPAPPPAPVAKASPKKKSHAKKKKSGEVFNP